MGPIVSLGGVPALQAALPLGTRPGHIVRFINCPASSLPSLISAQPSLISAQHSSAILFSPAQHLSPAPLNLVPTAAHLHSALLCQHNTRPNTRIEQNRTASSTPLDCRQKASINTHYNHTSQNHGITSTSKHPHAQLRPRPLSRRTSKSTTSNSTMRSEFQTSR